MKFLEIPYRTKKIIKKHKYVMPESHEILKNSTRIMNIMKIKILHSRITKFTKFLEFDARITKIMNI